MKRLAKRLRNDLGLTQRMRYPFYRHFKGTVFRRLDYYFKAMQQIEPDWDPKSRAFREYEREPSPYFDVLDFSKRMITRSLDGAGRIYAIKPRDRKVIHYEGMEDEYLKQSEEQKSQTSNPQANS